VACHGEEQRRNGAQLLGRGRLRDVLTPRPRRAKAPSRGGAFVWTCLCLPKTHQIPTVSAPD
jgi:hypothetical protein